MRMMLDQFGNWFVVMALAMALATVGFAHRVGLTSMTPELAAYVAEGGLLIDVCGAADGQSKSVSPDCDACRICDTFMPPDLPCVCIKEIAQTRIFAFVTKRIAERNDLDPARLSRAPPQA